MDVKILKKEKDEKLKFTAKGISSAFANSFRRAIVSEVPTMAIEDIEFLKNTTILYDEIVANRLGLVPLKTDLKSYELPSKCSCKGEGCAKCQLKLTLKASGEKTVYSGDMKTTDPKVIPVFEKIPIVKMLKDQELEFVATAVLGLGKEHMKWSPGLAWFTNSSKVTVVNKDADKSKYPSNAFDKSGKLSADQIVENGLIDACEGEDVKVDYIEDSFDFTIESWGQLKAVDIAKRACDVMIEKTEEFSEKLKGL